MPAGRPEVELDRDRTSTYAFIADAMLSACPAPTSAATAKLRQANTRRLINRCKIGSTLASPVTKT